MASLECCGITKSYKMPHGMIHVLRGADLSVERGERLSLMGASGAGKSTLLHLMAGLDTPDSGRILIEGDNFAQWRGGKRAAFRAKRVGFVFQSFHLMPDLNVIENVILPARGTRGYSKKAPEIRKRAERLLAQVGMQDRITHRPMELSGGEQQRVAVARSLIAEPDFLFADEPTGNLDEETGNAILDHLFALSSELSLTVVMVTHSSSIAKRCDRVLHLRDGLIEP